MARKKAKAGPRSSCSMSFTRTARSAPTDGCRPRRWAAWRATRQAETIIEAQDCEIAERSGRPRPPIKSASRVGRRKAPYDRPGKPAAQAPKARQ
jgi:hypothetical protein